MKLRALVIVLAACRSSAPPETPQSTEPPYLALFQSGRTWSLPIEVASFRKQGDAWIASPAQRGTVSCHVAEVKEVGDANVARLACSPPHAGLLVVGTWVATPAGLYHPLLPVDDADELTLLGDDDLMLTRAPKERQHSRALDGVEDSIDTFSFKGSWCVRSSTASATDRRDYTLCFNTNGITGGGELVISGDTLTRALFGAAPADPDDPTVAH